MDHQCRQTRFTPWILFILTVLFVGALAPYGLSDLLHDAMAFKPALDIAAGQVIFRDSYSQYGPIPALMQAACILLFGPHLLPVRYSIALLFGIAAIFLYLVWSQFCRPLSAALGVVLWCLMQQYVIWPIHTLPSIYAMFFQICALYCFCMGLSKDSRVPLIFSGAFAAAAFFSKQNIGVYLYLALIAAALVDKRISKKPSHALTAEVAAVTLGVAALSLPMLVWLWSANALSSWYTQNIYWPRFWATFKGANNPFLVSLLFPAGAGASSVWFFSLLGACTLGQSIETIISAIRQQPLNRYLAVTALVATASWMQYYPIPGDTQLGLACTPMIGLFVYTLDRIGSAIQLARAPTWGSTALLCSLISMRVLMFSRLEGQFEAVHGNNPFLGLRMRAPDRELVEAIAEDIDLHLNELPEEASKAILDPGSNAPMVLAFLRNHRPFHPVWFPGHPQLLQSVYPGYQAQLNEYVANSHPPILVAKSYPGNGVGQNECGDLVKEGSLDPEIRDSTYQPEVFWVRKPSWYQRACFLFAIYKSVRAQEPSQ